MGNQDWVSSGNNFWAEKKLFFGSITHHFLGKRSSDPNPGEVSLSLSRERKKSRKLSRFVAPLPIRLWAWRKSDNRGRYEHSYGNVPMDALLTFPSGGKKERGKSVKPYWAVQAGRIGNNGSFFQAHSWYPCIRTLPCAIILVATRTKQMLHFLRLEKSYFYYCRVDWRILESQAAIYSLCTCAHSICVLFPLPPPPKTPLGFPPPPPPFPFSLGLIPKLSSPGKRRKQTFPWKPLVMAAGGGAKRGEGS